MANNFSKLWIQKLLNSNAIRRAQEEIQSTGRALPCTVTAITGAIVTVEFAMDPWTLPPISIPKAESPWIRMPTQVGDKGVAFPSDRYIGSLSGLGLDLNSPPGNLSSLIFVPVSNAKSNPIDPNAAQIEGPNGAIIRTSDGKSEIKVSPTGIESTFEKATCTLSSSAANLTFDTASCDLNGTNATLSFGATSVVVDASGVTIVAGGVPIKFTSSGLSVNGVDYLTHEHLYTPGTGTPTNTGVPV